MAGFAPFLLLQAAAIQKAGYTAKKVTPKGYLEMLLSNGQPNLISQSVSDASGHVRDVKYWYRQRGIGGQSRTTDDCDIDARPSRLEGTIPSTLFRVSSWQFDDELIAKYEKEASAVVGPAAKAYDPKSPLPSIMMEIWDSVVEQANGLLIDINSDLMDLQAVAFGVNVVTGSNASQTLNFGLSTTTNPLNEGLTKLLTDARANEIDITSATIVGSGFIDAVYMQRVQNALSNAQNGVNQSNLSMPKYFYDPMAATKFGANQFGLFEKDAVQLLSVDRYVGFKSGFKGNSYFFNITLPITNSLGGNELSNITFDCQMFYSDCPQTINVGGSPTAVGRGWNLIMSKSFYQVNKPSDSFASGDRLEGANGTLRYTATNA